MFEFMNMMGNHQERLVDRYEADGVIVDTCLVNDSDQPYETGIKHPCYNNSDWVIVELYDTKEEAQIGHNKWVKTITSKKLPKTLKDVSTTEILKWGNNLGIYIDREFIKED